MLYRARSFEFECCVVAMSFFAVTRFVVDAVGFFTFNLLHDSKIAGLAKDIPLLDFVVGSLNLGMGKKFLLNPCYTGCTESLARPL